MAGNDSAHGLFDWFDWFFFNNHDFDMGAIVGRSYN